MVHIEVDDRDALDSMSPPYMARIRGTNCHVVDEAEASAAMLVQAGGAPRHIAVLYMNEVATMTPLLIAGQ